MKTHGLDDKITEDRGMVKYSGKVRRKNVGIVMLKLAQPVLHGPYMRCTACRGYSA